MMSSWDEVIVLIDGVSLDAIGTPPIVGLRLERGLNEPAALSLNFQLQTPTFDPDRMFRQGQKISLKVGSDAAFDGCIRRHQRLLGPDGLQFNVTARDSLSELTRSRQAVVEEIDSVKQFAAKMANLCNLRLGEFGLDFSAGRHINRSPDDLGFLAAVLDRYGLAFVCRDGLLELLDLTDSEATAASLLETIYRLNEVSEPSLDNALNWLGWCPDDDGTVRFGQRELLGSKYNPGPVGRVVRAREPAKRLYDAASAYTKASSAWFEAELDGLCNLWPGDNVKTLPGKTHYRISTIELLLDVEGGARTRVSTRPAKGIGEASTAGSFFNGVVYSTADPLNAGRVRISLPGYDGLQTSWLSVVGPVSKLGGGTGLGIPLAVGDSVLLAAPEGDPEMGFVLGGLIRAGGAQTDLHSDGQRTGQAWRASGASISMQEDGASMVLTLDGGSTVEMTKDHLRLKASSRLELDCDGEVSIRGSSIEFEQA